MSELIKVSSLFNDPTLAAYWRLESDKEINSIAALLADSALKGYWRLENVNDTSASGYNLTNNGTVTFTAGKFSNCGVFNGSNQWLSIVNGSAPNLYTTGDQTICAWVYPTSSAGDNMIFSNANNAGNTGFFLQIKATTRLLDFRSLKSGDDQSVTSSNALVLNQWNFIAVSFTSSGQAVTLFVNGVKTTGTFSRALVATTANTDIGRTETGGGISYFPGNIDDVAFFNRALTNAEIMQIYGLSDSTANRNGLTPVGGPTSVTGRYGSGVDFEESSSQSLVTPDSSSLSIVGDLTIAVWAKWESLTGQEMTLAGKYFGTPNASYLFTWDGTDHLTFYVSSDGTAVTATTQSFIPVVGVWYHLAIVYNAVAGTVRFYKNAIDIGGGSGLPNSIFNNASPFRIGAYGVPAAFFDGILDDVAVFAKVLTQNQIRLLAKSASGLFLLI